MTTAFSGSLATRSSFDEQEKSSILKSPKPRGETDRESEAA